MELLEQINKETKSCNEVINSFLPKEEGYQKSIMEAMNYSVAAGGKRLRPMLLNETYKLFGGQGKDAYPFMAAIEFIHTYSLVHNKSISFWSGNDFTIIPMENVLYITFYKKEERIRELIDGLDM